MTTVNFQTNLKGKVIITADRSDIKSELQGVNLIDVLETTKKAIDDFIEEVKEKL